MWVRGVSILFVVFQVPPDLPQQIKYLAGVLLENPSAHPKIP